MPTQGFEGVTFDFSAAFARSVASTAANFWLASASNRSSSPRFSSSVRCARDTAFPAVCTAAARISGLCAVSSTTVCTVVANTEIARPSSTSAESDDVARDV